MSDYTPDTLQVRTSACWSAKLDPDEFDRWLAEHDAEVVKATEGRAVEIINEHNIDITEVYEDICTCGERIKDVDEHRIALIRGENE